MVQKKHIVKTQLIINEENKSIKHCCTELEGRKSDLKIFKETPIEISPKIKVKGDLGYLGIERIHPNSKIPHKKPKNGELTKQQKKENKRFRKKESKSNM
jgi:hypothetical protein